MRAYAFKNPPLSPSTRTVAVAVIVLMVLSIASVASADDFAEFRTRRSALAPNDVEGRLDLADWCLATTRAGRRAAGKSFRVRAATLFNEVLALAPRNARAHRGLGHVFIDGKWDDSPAARADEIRRLRRRFAAAGLVTFAHGWETAEGKERRAAGLVYAGGAWRTPEQARAARGFARIDGKWVEPKKALAIATGRRFTQLTQRKYDAVLHRHVIWVVPSASGLMEHGEAVNKAVDDLLALTGRAGAASPFPWPARVIVMAKADDVEVEVFEREYGYLANMAPVWGRPTASGVGIRAVRDRSGRWLLGVNAPKPAKDGADVRALVLEGLVHAALFDLHPRAPFWLTAGLAGSVQAIRAPGYLVVHDSDGRCTVTKSSDLASAKKLKAALAKVRRKDEGACSLERLLAVAREDAKPSDRLLAIAFVTWTTGHLPGITGRLLTDRVDATASRAVIERVAKKSFADVQAAFDKWLASR